MTPTQPAAADPLDESWTKALAIVAHPDDLEFGAAAADRALDRPGQAHHLRDGHQRRGRHRRAGTRTSRKRVREAEQIESARIVGVDTVEFLGFQDGVVEYGLDAAGRDRQGGPRSTSRRSSSPATSATRSAA